MLSGTFFSPCANCTICISYLIKQVVCVKKNSLNKTTIRLSWNHRSSRKQGKWLWQNRRRCYSQSQWAAKLSEWWLPAVLSTFTLGRKMLFTSEVYAIILFLSQPHTYTCGANSGLHRMLFMSLWGKKSYKCSVIKVLSHHHKEQSVTL